MNTSRLTAFQSLFQEVYPELVKVALFYLRDLSLAEDIVQEIFVRLWEQGKDLNRISYLKAYLYQAVKNRCLNDLEHRKVIGKYQEEFIRHSREDEQSPHEYLHQVRLLLEQLPPKRRVILEMSVSESKSYQEIADQLDISINTVKDHIKKAYAFLRQHLHTTPPRSILYLALIRP